MSNSKRWFVVMTYAAAMAWVESSVVFYLRSMVDRIEPYQPNPLPIATGFAKAELVREAATLLMLLTVGILAGRTWRSRLGYTAIAFGFWDVFYYVFLKVLCGWPHSLLDWDILFLIPLPWWAPVLAPVLVALLLVLWGTLATSSPGGPGVSPVSLDSGVTPPPGTPNLRSPNFRDALPTVHALDRKVWLLNFVGIVLALYVFMADNLRIVNEGVNAWRNTLPTRFNWPLFCLALLFMAVPILEAIGKQAPRLRTEADSAMQ
jgi:hypothetical protein